MREDPLVYSLDWSLIATNLPPNGVEVWTKIHDENGGRNVQKLRRDGRFWRGRSPSGAYIYYTPTHWAAVEEFAS